MRAGPPTGADAHTRLVGLAKIALPLGGLALLSSLFLLAGEAERPSAPLASEVSGIAREQRLSAPVHAGMTEAGDAIEVSARVARPDPSDPRLMEAEELRAHVETPEGERIDLEAPGAGSTPSPGSPRCRAASASRDRAGSGRRLRR